jgi:hypothetical protein
MPRATNIALFLFGTHILLLFFPPIPPDIKGSLWSHLLWISAVIAAAIAINQNWEWVLRTWFSRGVNARLLLTLLCLLIVVVVGRAFYVSAYDIFLRFSKEYGVWEPLSTFLYLASAILLSHSARVQTDALRRRHLIFMTSLYVFLVLEEVDYLGLFGGFLQRIDGVYVGAVHDIVDLWGHDLLSPTVITVLFVLTIAILAALWRLRYFQPGALLQSLRYPRLLFAITGSALIVLALSIEAGFIPWAQRMREAEELVELTGAICLAAFAIDLAAEQWWTLRHASD